MKQTLEGSPDTPQQVLNKLLQVDGSGSGLDSDLIDGIDGVEIPTTSQVYRQSEVDALIAPLTAQIAALQATAFAKVETVAASESHRRIGRSSCVLAQRPSNCLL
jgi:hypothetical protein